MVLKTKKLSRTTKIRAYKTKNKNKINKAKHTVCCQNRENDRKRKTRTKIRNLGNFVENSWWIKNNRK